MNIREKHGSSPRLVGAGAAGRKTEFLPENQGF